LFPFVRGLFVHLFQNAFAIARLYDPQRRFIIAPCPVNQVISYHATINRNQFDVVIVAKVFRVPAWPLPLLRKTISSIA